MTMTIFTVRNVLFCYKESVSTHLTWKPPETDYRRTPQSPFQSSCVPCRSESSPPQSRACHNGETSASQENQTLQALHPGSLPFLSHAAVHVYYRAMAWKREQYEPYRQAHAHLYYI